MRLPRNPVIKNNFHVAEKSGKIVTRYKTIPIKKPPIKFAAKTPAANEEKIGFNAITKNQRVIAPIAAPDAIAIKVFTKINTYQEDKILYSYYFTLKLLTFLSNMNFNLWSSSKIRETNTISRPFYTLGEGK